MAMTDADLIVKALVASAHGETLGGEDLKRLAFLAARSADLEERIAPTAAEPARPARVVDPSDLADNPDAPPLDATIHVPGDDPQMGRGGFR